MEKLKNEDKASLQKPDLDSGVSYVYGRY